ncbi:MAG: tetratricopeptide repeat protein [Nevskia sp.]|nr:tetratricopeptide repeat protein [Nevskia sp.]
MEIPTQTEADLTADATLSADPVQAHRAARIDQRGRINTQNQKQARHSNAPTGIIMKQSIRKRIGIVLGCILAASASGTAWAKAELTGLVVLEHEHGAPQEGVAVSAPGANQDTSLSDGTFKLEFPKYGPGDEARLIITRPGWVVVNEFQLQRPLPKLRAAPLKIIICKAPDREKFALVFYRLKGTQAVEKTYQRKLAELEKKTTSTAADLAKLREERDQALKQVEDLSRQLAALAPDSVGQGVYREALQLYLDGQLDAALAALSDARLIVETEAAQKGVDEVVRGWLLKAGLQTLRFDFAGAALTYQAAVTRVPGSLDAWFEYGYFSQMQNHFPEAGEAYRRALVLARESENAAQIALILNNLGALERTENHNDAARQAYEESLAIYRALARQNPDVYQPDVARGLNNLGELERAENHNDAARQAYEESLAIYRALARQNPDVYRPDVARSLNNLGELERAENRHDAARRAHQESLAIYRELAQQSPDVYRPNIAANKNNLGNLESTEKHFDAARKAYEEALAIYRDFAKRAPDAYAPYVRTVEKNLAALPQ